MIQTSKPDMLAFIADTDNQIAMVLRTQSKKVDVVFYIGPNLNRIETTDVPTALTLVDAVTKFRVERTDEPSTEFGERVTQDEFTDELNLLED